MKVVHFSQHYTVPEARALLPKVRQWLGDLESCQKRLLALDKGVGALTARGDDAGGEAVNQLVRALGGGWSTDQLAEASPAASMQSAQSVPSPQAQPQPQHGG